MLLAEKSLGFLLRCIKCKVWYLVLVDYSFLFIQCIHSPYYTYISNTFYRANYEAWQYGVWISTHRGKLAVYLTHYPSLTHYPLSPIRDFRNLLRIRRKCFTAATSRSLLANVRNTVRQETCGHRFSHEFSRLSRLSPLTPTISLRPM